MPTSYKLGRDTIATLPGVSNDDIIGATVNVSGNQIDITTFVSTGTLTKAEYMVGLVDITVDVTCTDTDATVGDAGTADIAGIGANLEAVVLDVKTAVTPKGKVEYTVTYGFQDA